MIHKLEVKLKQHTPLIHFQHDQEGATLRASEVKPKLDKYIIEQLKESGKYDEGVQDGWIKSKGDKIWLDYHMKIETSEPINYSMDVLNETDRNRNQKRDEIGRPLYKTPNYPDNQNSLIMGNMGGRIQEEVLNFVMFKKVAIILLFRNKELCDKVKASIFAFFIKNNFGNRTSKGFGSFKVFSINGESCTEQPLVDYLVSFSLNPSDGEEISASNAMKDIFIVINKMWKGLKSYSRVPSGEQKSVFLNVQSQLTNQEERIPSPISFKPILKSQLSNKWEVDIYIFLKHDVISAANADSDNFYDLLDNYMKDNGSTFINGNVLSYNISDIKVL